jgi:hypothetical protein
VCEDCVGRRRGDHERNDSKEHLEARWNLVLWEGIPRGERSILGGWGEI